MENETFENLIKERFDRLSAGQKKVADYMLQNLEEAAFSRAFQIGKKVEVSETTVIRLSYALGFDGFTEMQDKIQRQLLLSHQAASNKREQIQDRKSELSPFAKVIENEVHILREILHQTNEQQLWNVVDAIIKGDQIFIAGFRTSYAAAYWFSYTLSMLRENVILCPPSVDWHERLNDLTKDSVVLVISFPRYAKETVHIAESAKKQGITLISVTDRALSPVGRISDMTLTTEENVESGSNSIAPVISLLDLVITGINRKDKERIQSRQRRLEEMYSTYEVFME
ncbi:MurR/RpiR family transcriptional regulator [Ammoniphilus sp. 3BR4]|uniref:MurR/RpiR family transcriptional regulator n=1 Tax=Ammoniphilus sp. 3BR4 TaxID=3158265 RepID=UPI00346697D9